jgi:hypothetical protein
MMRKSIITTCGLWILASGVACSSNNTPSPPSSAGPNDMPGDASVGTHMDGGATRHEDSGSIIGPTQEAGDNMQASMTDSGGTIAPVDGGVPVADAARPPVDGAPVAMLDATSPDAAIYSPACLGAGGTCVPAGAQCPGTADPSLGCGDPSMETCCVPNLFQDGGFDAAILGVDCLIAGGTCQLATTPCTGGAITGASCGDPATWMCCGGVYDAGIPPIDAAIPFDAATLRFDASFLFDSGL